MIEKLVSRSGTYKFCLYVPEQDEEMFTNFIKDCQTCGCSASSVLLDFIRARVPVVEKEANVCDLCQKGSDRIFVARFVSGQKLSACPECFQEKFEKGLVRAVIKRPVEVFNPNLFGVNGKP